MTEPEPSNADADTASSNAETWLAEHGDALFAYAFRRLRDRDTAEDLVQETLLAALGAETRYTGAARRRTWLISILKHKVIDHLRRKREIVASQSDPADEGEGGASLWFDQRGMWRHGERPDRWTPEPATLLEDAEFWTVFDQCLDGLPARQAEAFALRELEQCSSEEACNVLGVKPTNLSVLLHRARSALRRCLEQRWFALESKDAG